MLHKHYFPNQQTPLLGRQIKSIIAILEKRNQGARSAKTFKLILEWGFFAFFRMRFLCVCVVVFGMGTASRLACKSCWALLDLASAKLAKQPGRAQTKHRSISRVASSPPQRSGPAGRQPTPGQGGFPKKLLFPHTVELYNLNRVHWALLEGI